MDFTYEIKGVTLNMMDMMEISKYYGVVCTAEYLLDNYDITEEEVIDLAHKVRRHMDKCDCTESEAIEEIMENDEN